MTAVNNHASKTSRLSIVSLLLGIITAIFTIFYALEVLSHSIRLTQQDYFNAFLGTTLVLSFLGLVLGILGMRACHARKAWLSIVLCTAVFVALLFIDAVLAPAGLSV